MTSSVLTGASLKGVVACTPDTIFDNERDTEDFDPVEVKKVVAMAGVKERRVVDQQTCSSDLCRQAAEVLLAKLNWPAETVDVLIFVTQTPDYFLPSTASLLHRDLQLSTACAAFDVGLGCSGYPYGLWLASMMVQTGSARRILLLHGETPSRFTHPQDRSTVLLFGDAGSATAIEADGDERWGFCLHSDGQGYDDLIIPGRGFRQPSPENDRDNYLHMDGKGLFNFTVQKVPALIEDTLTLMQMSVEDIDAFLFHQSNQFIMRHIAKKCQLPMDKIPIILGEFGNSGGPSVPLTMVKCYQDKVLENPQQIMLLGYGVGLSWGSAVVCINADTQFVHTEYRCNGVSESLL